ncbi:MAG: site-specific DNA-methyltransferase [Oscillospiraceae bacterium]|jgi:site-specific DNA-methyltransferase (adenine-specific)|nr:site-specific DNA-methyltransferase [Oscillospiraceae bacterium]
MEKAPRNRTLHLSDREIVSFYLKNDVPLSSLHKQDVIDKVFCGDFFSIVGSIPESIFDLLILDPPYNMSKQFGSRHFTKMSDDDYSAYFENLLLKTLPCMKKTASIYVCCDWRTSLIIGNVLKKYVIIQNRITWQREKGRGASHNWKNSMEDIWFSTMGEEYYFNVSAVMQRRRVIAPYKKDGKPKDWEETDAGSFRNTHPSNFWDDITVPYWSMPENTDHPAQKPEKLIAKLILASSKAGEIVFDPFLGSGTTAVVAKKLGRRYFGIELETKYYALAQKRLELADLSQLIQGYSDGVFWERNTLNAIKTKRAKEDGEYEQTRFI